MTPAFRPEALPLTPAREAAQREAVIAQARRWTGTPYRQQGDTIGAGVDCCMLLVRAWVDAGLVQPFDPRPYPPEWFLHREDERYLAWLAGIADETATPRPGDIALWRFGRCYSHSAIVLGGGRVIHAVAAHGNCTMSDMHEPWLACLDRTGTRPRPVKFFDVWARWREVGDMVVTSPARSAV